MTTAPLPIVIIAAVARNGVIGARGRMPWRLPGDLAHFRAETWGKPVIVGRRTLEAIGGPLPGRACIVLSRDPAYRVAGAGTAADLEGALTLAQEEGRRIGASEVMVAGGAAVYAVALSHADELRLTEVDLEPDGDTRFPPIDRAVWQECERVSAGRRADDETSYAFVRFTRRG